MKTNQRIFIGAIAAIMLLCALIGIGAMAFGKGQMRGESGRGIAYAQNLDQGQRAESQTNDGNDNAQMAPSQNANKQGQDEQKLGGRHNSNKGRGESGDESFGIFGAALKLAALLFILGVLGLGAWLLFFRNNTMRSGVTSLIDDLHRRAHATPTQNQGSSSMPETTIVVDKAEDKPADSPSI